jgi:hypothetical protein
MVMRPERVTEERIDPYLGQMDCRDDEGSQSRPGPMPGNASPHPRAAARIIELRRPDCPLSGGSFWRSPLEKVL